MLTVKYIDDEDSLLKLFDRIGRHDTNVSGINAVLTDEDEAIGLCRMILTEKGIEIVEFTVAKDKNDDPFVSDFFFRTVLFKLSKSDIDVWVKTTDERIKQFGFKKDGEYMTVNAANVEFPSACGHHPTKNLF